MSAELWTREEPTPAPQPEKDPGLIFNLRINDPVTGRSFRGRKTVTTHAASESDPPFPTPLKSTRVHLELGYAETPPVVSLDYGYSNYFTGPAAHIAVTAIDATNTLHTVAYYEYPAFSETDRPAGAFRRDNLLELQMEPETAARLNYYRYEELPDRISCKEMERLVWDQMEKGEFSNPRLTPPPVVKSG